MFQNTNTSIVYQRIFTLILILIILVNCNGNTEFEQDCSMIAGKNCAKLKTEGVDKSFTFLNDTSWLNYNSYEEKLQACQIPDLILAEMCTYNLVKTCLVHYPFLLDLTVFNNIQNGFERYKNALNGIQELIRRCDGCLEIIDHYRKSSLLIHPDSTFTSQGSWGVYYTEIFLAQPDFFDSLSKNDRLGLFQLTVNVKTLKLSDNRHGQGSVGSTNWILSRIMVFENYSPFINEVDNNQNLNHFIETMFPLEMNGIKQIDSLINHHATKFIKTIK